LICLYPNAKVYTVDSNFYIADCIAIDKGKELEKAFEEWINHKGENYEQIDDVTVVGLKI